ncbi:MAG: hypothetical protein GYA24_05125 [Candidatus Lokiarchaeota archaeon]|nr:hypothetical protein [Candidatus Lokiarchaeota archaeon]
MTGEGKCANCGASFVRATAVCQKCHAGIPLCNSCKSGWAAKSCPKCGSSFANWIIV